MADPQGVGAGQVPPNFLYRQLSRFPVGLLRWFGIPSGSNPQELQTNYQPVLDLWEWLTSTNASYLITAGTVVNAATAGTFLLHTINSAHGLYVLDYTIRSTPLVGAGVVTVSPSIQPQAGTGVEVVMGPPSTTGIGGGAIVLCRADKPFFVGPNAVGLSSIVSTNGSANPCTLFGYVRYVNLTAPDT